MTHLLESDKITVLAILESLLHAGKHLTHKERFYTVQALWYKG
ncbi:hypothetical protein [Symbiopectobacterium purcellii]